MKPVQFNEQTKILLKPDSMTDEECGSLPVYCDGRQTISCWQLSWCERLALLLRGRIWLGVVCGSTQPPVWLDAAKTVFSKPEKKGGE